MESTQMTRFGRVAAVILTLLAAACSDAPVAPQTQTRYTAQANDMSALARYRSGSPGAVVENKWIGPEGGTISAAGFEVVVPAGAVATPTKFTIKLPSDASMANYVWAEFMPHGIQFAVPVTLKVPYAGTTSDVEPTAHVLWFNGATWVQLPTSFTGDGRLQTQTTHFSDYGTEETEQRGVTPVGG